MNLKEIFNDNKANKRATHLKKFFKTEFNWNDVVKLMELVWDDDNYFYKNNTDKRGYFQFLMKFPSEFSEIDLSLNDILKQIDNPETELPEYIQLFVNLISENYTTHRHRDNWDGIFMQLNGSVEWKIFENMEGDPVEKFLIESGDILLIPRGVYHTVTPLGPRISLNLGFGDWIRSNDSQKKIYSEYIE